MNEILYNDGIDYKGKSYQKVEPLDWQKKKYANKKFGKLLVECPVWVQGLVTKPDSTNAIWLTHCDCGNDYCISMQWIRKEIKKGVIPDCGCEEREEWSKKYIGKTYNYLTILERDEEYKKKINPTNANAYYKCQCRCGNIISARITAIVNGEIKSCGCLKKAQDKINLIPQTIHDLTGQHFGLLTAIKGFQKQAGEDYWWQCKCNCGNIVEVRGYSLLNGDTRSCGCLSKSHGELDIENILKENNIKFLYNNALFKDLKLPSGGTGRYDFILLDEKYHPYRLIEYDGEQHFHAVEYFGGEEEFKKLQKNDKVKNEYAKIRNLPLVRIPYTEDNITLELLLSDKYLVN